AGVMREKLALLDGVPVAVVGTDPPELAAAARRRTRTIVAGRAPPAEVRPEAAELDDAGRAVVRWRGHTFTLPVVGLHQVDNAMIALAVAGAVGEFGPAFARHAATLGPRLLAAPDAEALGAALRARLRGNEVVLLKASRGVALERVLAHLP